MNKKMFYTRQKKISYDLVTLLLLSTAGLTACVSV